MDIPLTFATFFACGIKQFTSLTQLNCINLLLKGHAGSVSIEKLSDSVCSNYAKGKKNLTNDLRVELLNLTEKDAIDRLKMLNIQDFTTVSNALLALVENSSLSDNEKKKLVNCHQSKDDLVFIAAVFLKCLQGDNSFPINTLITSTLEGYRHNTVSTNRTVYSPTIPERTTWGNASVSESQADTITNNTGNDEDFDWIRNYVPELIINTPPAFIRDKVISETVVLELPIDYDAMIYALKPALTESAYETFTIEVFTKTMDIDTTRNTFNLQKGSLEYLQLEGSIETILPSLKNYNFSMVSDFALQLIGEFTSKDVNELKQCLKDISNDNVNILTSLIFDKELTTVKLVLIVHKCNEKVKEQMADKDHDGTREYIPRRHTENGRKN